MPPTAEYDAGQALWVVHIAEDRSDDRDVDAQIAKAVTDVRGAGGGDVQLWIHAVTDQADAIARNHRFSPYRDLWQLRCALPAAPSPLATRPFTRADIDAIVRVNNRAFSWHPEQSGLTPEALDRASRHDWFDPDGFRLYERDDELVGFCWTKIHRDHDPVLGEIYVIAVDPSAHGQGLGIPMTLAGLDWLASKGIADGMLYVESDNDPANATYRRIGFVRHHIDRAYALAVPVDSDSQ